MSLKVSYTFQEIRQSPFKYFKSHQTIPKSHIFVFICKFNHFQVRTNHCIHCNCEKQCFKIDTNKFIVGIHTKNVQVKS